MFITTPIFLRKKKFNTKLECKKAKGVTKKFVFAIEECDEGKNVYNNNKLSEEEDV